MKIDLYDTAYGGEPLTFSMKGDRMGSDLSLMFGFLENYKKELEYFTQTLGHEEFSHAIVWKEKINQISQFQNKYKRLLEFINNIEEEENAL